MNILVLNGSPRGSKSNTLKITNAFIEGLESESTQMITRVNVSEKKIGHCLGCFACWKDTPGTCVIKDDMAEILEHIRKADLVIWSFPLYYFSMPSKIKALMDRMLPLNLPFIEEDSEGCGTHPPRYNISSQRTVLISTCGFYSTSHNYEALKAQFDIAFGQKKVTKILCPEGELFSQSTLKTRTDEYLSHVRLAGAQYSKSGIIFASTEKELSRLLFSKEIYTTIANASWGVERETEADTSSSQTSTKSIKDPSVFYLRQMSALYNPRSLAGQEAILEFYFTDLEVTHRLYLGKTACSVLDSDSHSPVDAKLLKTIENLPVTRIETPYSVWQEIGEGKMDGATAMMEGKYRVLGNFDLMLKMDGLFAGPDQDENTHSASPSTANTVSKKTNLSLVILPWLPLWVALPISTTAGLLAGIGGLVLFQLAGLKWKIGNHERIALASVSLVVLGIAIGVPSQILIPLTYLGFGLQWLLSCFTAIPLTAYYSGAGYGGDAAIQNPLFIKTNRIITAVWGIVYTAITVWTWFLLASPLAPFTAAINSIPPALCGIWTAWYPRWYIAKVARGK